MWINTIVVLSLNSTSHNSVKVEAWHVFSEYFFGLFGDSLELFWDGNGVHGLTG